LIIIQVYFTLKHQDFNIIFTNGSFAVILSAGSLPAVNRINFEIQPSISPNKTRKSPYLVFTICKYPCRNVKSNKVCLGLKWFIDISWFPTTEQEILAVFEAAVLY